MKVNYESTRSQQRIEKEKMNNVEKKESDLFPHTKGRHDFQLMGSLYSLDSYQRDNILLEGYMEESRGGFTKLLQGLHGTCDQKRSPGERPYSVVNRIFHGVHVFVTMAKKSEAEGNIHVYWIQSHGR